MKHTVSSDRTTRTVIVKVEPEGDECDFDATETWHARPRTIRPQHVEVVAHIASGRTYVRASGAILRRDGTPGGVNAEMSWRTALASGHPGALDKAPPWVRDLVAEVLA